MLTQNAIEEVKLEIETARAFLPLLQPSRYKAAKGGRGSGKSHFFAELQIESHLLQPGRRTVCVREVQKTLRESAKKLLEDKIKQFGLHHQGFRMLDDRIETPGDGVFSFMGMTDSTAESIKSLEGYDCAWVEEAQTMSAKSLQLLRPTIRKENSELHFSWNPRRKKDPVDAFFCGDEKPSNAIVVHANWDQNPWFTDVLEQERLDDLRMFPDQYDHIWNGGYVTAIEGAYLAKQLAVAREEGRIGFVPRDPLMRVYAIWDIGGTGAKADACAIWIVQFIGVRINIIDYYEAQGQELSDHVHWLRKNDYSDAEIKLPHDGTTHDRIHRITYESELKKAGFKVETIPNAGSGAAMQRVEAARRIFHRCFFHEEKCEAGIEALGWYHEKKDPNRLVGLGPDHDWSSHAFDAFGLMALISESLSKIRIGQNTGPRRIIRPRSDGWMGS